VEVLGHVLSDEGINLFLEKFSPFLHWKFHLTFLNYNHFLVLLAIIESLFRTLPIFILYKLTSKNTPFLWTEDHTIAFNSLKNTICSSPILKYLDPEKLFIIRTDAFYAVGVVLLQFYEDTQKEHPTYF